ncbi:iron-containing alcohol dehydrogenase [Leptospira yanagawae]|uniref:Iron-containing alcohol dehydrogenase n=1 Tax=Leptospira yanagawae TaxID=293069 RepID=A0ABY2LYD1_9LEPT|nr:iron-containing alcohol dehydrogenase family protein [Leptospira yanagawae]TGL16975.1 iron-containing alcohol dehydrogenase [Leptospira yanagawae]
MPLAKNVSTYLFETKSIKSLKDLIRQRKKNEQDYVVFLIDHYFSDNDLFKDYIDVNDLVLYIDTTDEPTTDQVDELTKTIRTTNIELPVSLVGIGGGSTLDITKAVSNLLTNHGNAEDYQGWDLVKVQGIYKIGIPTISGTGAEASRTCVMMNERKNLKLGMNSEFTIYDHLILDPELTKSVPRDQYFYTGMDTYIHCVESLEGNHRHALADAFSREALNLCREVFLGDEDMMSDVNRQKLMAASYLGGSALANSFVGIVHPFSAGLSMTFHTHHCIANCLVMNQMGEFYSKWVPEFKEMLKKQKISLPSNVCKGKDEATFQKLYDSTIIHEKPLGNALGSKFREILTFEKVKEVFSKI